MEIENSKPDRPILTAAYIYIYTHSMSNVILHVYANLNHY